jgi:hypothetical protein
LLQTVGNILDNIVIGNVILDAKLMCDVAVEIINCTRQELGDCIAAEVDKYRYYSYFYLQFRLDW